MASLADAHIVGQERLRANTARVVGSVWMALPAYDEANVPPFLEAAVPVVRAAQRASVALTDGYVASALGRPAVGVDPADIIGAAARDGTSPDEVYRRPFVTVWTALAEGKRFEDAVASGLARATSTAEMDVQLASRGAFAAVQRADRSIQGYQRVIDSGACAFCRRVNGAFVKSATAMPLHNRCGCSLQPVTSFVQASRVPEGVAVREHGELGAVLVDPAHDFAQI